MRLLSDIQGTILSSSGSRLNKPLADTYRQSSDAGVMINYYTTQNISEFEDSNDPMTAKRFEDLVNMIEATGAQSQIIFFDGIAEVTKDGLTVIERPNLQELNHGFSKKSPKAFQYIQKEFFGGEQVLYVDDHEGNRSLGADSGMMVFNPEVERDIHKLADILSEETNAEIKYNPVSKPVSFAATKADVVKKQEDKSSGFKNILGALKNVFKK